jgi:hypothetical protein
MANKTKPHVVADTEPPHDRIETPVSTEEQLDAEEAEFRALRRDLAGVKGASGAGIIAISVSKTPMKNEFLWTHASSGRSCHWSMLKSEWKGNTSL